MNLIEQGKFYKTKILIDINANVYFDTIFKYENKKIQIIKRAKKVIELTNSIVFPSFVNAHTHLELTNIDKKKLNFISFIDWILSLIIEKKKKNLEFFLNSYKLGKKILNNFFTYTFGNILSKDLFSFIEEKDFCYNFVEIIEYNEENIEYVNLNYPKISIHSFFTVHPKLIEKILGQNLPISMHFFESKEEFDYLIYGTGPIVEKLYKFTNLTPLKYKPDYFKKFLLEGRNIQLVHLSNLPDFLKPLILKKKSSIFYTLCPRSNSKFGFKSPYRFFIKNKLPFSLGTDSLCSNDDLNVVNEAIFILEDMKDDIDVEILSKLLFLALTKWGYETIFVKKVYYCFKENIPFSKKDFSFYNFLKLFSTI